MAKADTQTGSDPRAIASDAVPVAIDIACPGCDYNLRGLPGPVVDCPECGLQSDVPELAARQWNKPWYKAPGFNTLTWPAVSAYGWYFFLVPMSSAYAGLNSDAAVLAVMLAGLTLWVLLMYLAYKVFDSAKGIWLALLMHVLVAGFLVSVLGLIVTIFMSAAELSDQGVRPDSMAIGLFAFLCFMGVFWVSRRIERAIAGACIRHHLRRRPTA